MAWFSRKPSRRERAPGVLDSGVWHSPGLASVCGALRRSDQPAVLDLGGSSSESFEFLGALAHDIVVQDIFHSSGEPVGQRAELFRFASADEVSLPAPADGQFDAILAWDVFHYLPRGERRAFGQRLAALCAEGGRVFVIASQTTPVPPTPIHFKILGDEEVEYVLGPARVEAPQLTTREVEQALAPLVPERVFQLRNGLRELVLGARAEPATGGS
ncbi:MAG: class I SAM-dependent methyltransferase [Acidobacteriota bacterium]